MRIRSPLCGTEAGPFFLYQRFLSNRLGKGRGSLTSLPWARAKPPPSRNTIFQGIFSFTVFQLRRAGGAFSLPGFSTPQAEEDMSPRANRPSLPSTWGLQSLMHARGEPPVLQHPNFVPESLASHPNLSGLFLLLPSVVKGTFQAGREGCVEALPCSSPCAYLGPESAPGCWRA